MKCSTIKSFFMSLVALSFSSLPLNETLWFGFYVTGPRHFVPLKTSPPTFKENGVYWVTLNEKKGSTPLANELFGGQPNRDFHFKDELNVLKFGRDTEWIDAKRLQTLVYLPTKTHNMAWEVKMLYHPPGLNEEL